MCISFYGQAPKHPLTFYIFTKNTLSGFKKIAKTQNVDILVEVTSTNFGVLSPTIDLQTTSRMSSDELFLRAPFQHNNPDLYAGVLIPFQQYSKQQQSISEIKL